MKLHSKPWYDQLAKQQVGYAPAAARDYDEGWGSGEEFYLRAVREHLFPEAIVGESGCAEGGVAIELSPLCQQITAYDRIEPYIDLARQRASEADIHNVEFICFDSSADANGGVPHLPFEDQSLDLMMSRRGPMHWLPDVRRVLKPGGIVLQLCMLQWRAPLPWASDLPSGLQPSQDHLRGFGRESVERDLATGDLHLGSYWEFDVPMYLPDPTSLYKHLCVGRHADDLPEYPTVTPLFEVIFEKYGIEGRLQLRQRRFMWKAISR